MNRERKINLNKNSKIPLEDRIFAIPALIGLFIFLFLFIFQPFHISETHKNKLLLTLSFGLLTFIILSFQSIVNKIVLKKNNPKVYNYYQKIKGFVIIIPIGIFNWLLLKLWYLEPPLSFLTMLWGTALIGLFPFLYTVIYIERKYYIESFFELKSKLETNRDIETYKKNYIVIESENIGEKVKFHPIDLLFIKAEGNYVSIHTISDNEPKKKTD